MRGMCRKTGVALSGVAHLWQSIVDILTTRLGTRVERRDYGSDVPALLDAPLNDQTIADVYAAVATALDKWEPRFRLTSVKVASAGADGAATLDLRGVYLPDGKEITLEGVEIA